MCWKCKELEMNKQQYQRNNQVGVYSQGANNPASKQGQGAVMLVPCNMAMGNKQNNQACMFPPGVPITPMMLCCIQGQGQGQGNQVATNVTRADECKTSTVKGGCCSKSNEKRLKCPPLKASYKMANSCVPSENVKGSFSGYHSEDICHGTGERRKDLIEELKGIINEFEETKCKVAPKSKTRNGLRELGSYEAYWMKHCQSWKPANPKPPLITSDGLHEVRISGDYDKVAEDSNEFVSYVDGRPGKATFTCECVKRNGLQDQCSHPMCKPPTAECLASNPGPCCPPSMGVGVPGNEPPPERNSPQKTGQGRPGASDPGCTEDGQQDTADPPGGRFSTTYRQDYQHRKEDQCGPDDIQMRPEPTSAYPTTANPDSGKPTPGTPITCLCNTAM